MKSIPRTAATGMMHGHDDSKIDADIVVKAMINDRSENVEILLVGQAKTMNTMSRLAAG